MYTVQYMYMCSITRVTGWRGAEPWLTTVAVGMRIRNEVGGAVDWVVDGYGMRVGHGRGQLEGSEIN